MKAGIFTKKARVEVDTTTQESIHFHSFPKNIDLTKKSIIAIRRDEGKNLKVNTIFYSA